MLSGKGIYIWKIRECEDGNIPNIVTMCQNANFSHVVIKIADGTSGYNFTTEDGDMAKELVQALQAVGIEAWGYQYIYGNDPVSEAITATRRMKETGCVGFVINAEHEIRDALNNDLIIDEYFTTMHNDELWEKTPTVLSSYRYPETHPKFPWEEVALHLHESYGDFYMPQVYWMQADNPAEQLWKCVSQYEKITDLPIVPTGSAFCEHGWCPTNEEILAFAEEAKRLGLPAINFWEWSATRRGGFWKTVRDIEYRPEEPPVDCCKELEVSVAVNTEQIRLEGLANIANATEIEELDTRTNENFVQVAKNIAKIIREIQDSITDLELKQREETQARKELDTAVYSNMNSLEDDINERIDGLAGGHSHGKLFSWLFNRK